MKPEDIKLQRQREFVRRYLVAKELSSMTPVAAWMTLLKLEAHFGFSFDSVDIGSTLPPEIGVYVATEMYRHCQLDDVCKLLNITDKMIDNWSI